MQLTEEQRDALNEAICWARDDGLPGTADHLRAILAAHNAGAQEPIATLHDDGYFTWKPGMRPQNVCQAGWRMDVFAAQPQLMTDAARDALKRAAEICRTWSAEVDTGNKRNRIVAAAMQGALSCAALIDAEIWRGEREGKTK